MHMSDAKTGIQALISCEGQLNLSYFVLVKIGI